MLICADDEIVQRPSRTRAMEQHGFEAIKGFCWCTPLLSRFSLLNRPSCITRISKCIALNRLILRESLHRCVIDVILKNWSDHLLLSREIMQTMEPYARQ